MRILIVFLALLGTVLCVIGKGWASEGATPAAAAIPSPSFDRIDYAHPDKYLDLSKSFGDKAEIRKLAATLKTDDPTNTLLAIGRWMQGHLQEDNKAAYTWRNFDQVVHTGIYGGCADHAIVFAALARACGIPTVFVKTMDVDWIREFRATGPPSVWSGHVFLEVFLNQKWQLLDAQGLRLYTDYDPRAHLFPDNRYAYDKGSDPYALLLSLDWERWKTQTVAYFSHFDMAQLPVPEGKALVLGRVYAAANSPIYQAVTERLRGQGYQVFSFNGDFDKYLPAAKGGDLIITCVGDRPVLPESYQAQYLPLSLAELRTLMQSTPGGVIRTRLADGTRLMLLYGKDNEALLAAINHFDLVPKE